jgi:hypothetical protein
MKAGLAPKRANRQSPHFNEKLDSPAGIARKSILSRLNLIT